MQEFSECVKKILSPTCKLETTNVIRKKETRKPGKENGEELRDTTPKAQK